MEVDELDRIARGILELGERQRVRLFMRADRYERFVSCLVFLPRDRFNTANRVRVGEILREALGAETVDWGLRLTEWVLVRIHYTLRVPGELPSFDVEELEARIVEATRSWDDDLQRRAAGGVRRGARHGAVPPLRRARSRPRTATTCWRARRSPTCSGSRRSRATRRSTSASTGRWRRRPACCAASSTGAASACRCPTCCRCSRALGLDRDRRAAVPGRAARRRAGVDLRLRAAGQGRRSMPTRSASASTRASRACGAARPSRTASTG